ncbi:hypothetical protein TNCT_191021 [Trichonephila clavata]|uniref:Uncharacterized protein n=1 Tax=Trichonephila clavata TaxID=2740835 RepID=A0A8X6I2K5_TRICU|nr:hypothetical protein TNCT_191021 [Trichonephila clavata]
MRSFGIGEVYRRESDDEEVVTGKRSTFDEKFEKIPFFSDPVEEESYEAVFKNRTRFSSSRRVLPDCVKCKDSGLVVKKVVSRESFVRGVEIEFWVRHSSASETETCAFANSDSYLRVGPVETNSKTRRFRSRPRNRPRRSAGPRKHSGGPGSRTDVRGPTRKLSPAGPSTGRLRCRFRSRAPRGRAFSKAGPEVAFGRPGPRNLREFRPSDFEFVLPSSGSTGSRISGKIPRAVPSLFGKERVSPGGEKVHFCLISTRFGNTRKRKIRARGPGGAASNECPFGTQSRSQRPP